MLMGLSLNAQVEVSMGYMVPLDDNYGKAYMSLGYSGIGTNLIIGGDSQISAGGQDVGRGYLGLEAYMNVLREDRGYWRLVPSIGFEIEQYYLPYDNPAFNDPNQGKAQIKTHKIGFSGGLKIGWRFIEVGYTTNNEITGGFKLSL